MIFKGFKRTLRFNVSHIIPGTGNIHNHTLELLLYIESDNSVSDDFLYKYAAEPINNFIDIYKDKLLNDIPPFDKIVPTLENFADYAFEQLSAIISEKGCCLKSLEISDSPHHSYCVTDEKPDAVTQKYIDQVAFRIKVTGKKAVEKTTAENEVKMPAEKTVAVKPALVADRINAVDNNISCDTTLKSMPAIYMVYSLLIIIAGGLLTTFLVYKSTFYPLGLDIHGHLFKSDIMYNGIKQGNFYPLFSQYWYNGIQPYRYWPPMVYYFMAFLQFLCGGNVINAYLAFVFSSFVIGGTGWLLFGRKLNRPVLGIVMALCWFYFPDNLRVFFGEGNMPRMFITMLLPMLFYFIWQFVCYKRKKMIIPAIIIMIVCIFAHLMISAMIGVLSFIFMFVYAVANREVRLPFYIILCELFCFAVCGIWVYPALQGGIVSMESSGNSDLMASLAGKLSDTLNPLIRVNGVTSLYIGLSIALIALIGAFFSNRKSMSGFITMILIILGTTTALTPVIQLLPLSQLFWVRRFLPIAYTVFVVAVFEWKKLKKPILVAMCCLLVADCIPSFDLMQYDRKMNLPATQKDIEQTMNDTLITEAKQITKNRVSLMDLSTFGPMPSYAFGTLEPKTEYVFGWAWQGASTAQNIVNINEALERENYTFMFDRNLELGADTVIVSRSVLKNQFSYDKLYMSAEKTGYKLVDASPLSLLFHYDADGKFGIVTNYDSIAIGSSASIVQMLLPSYRVGNKLNIDEYTVEELCEYKNILLSGFFYKYKGDAEKLIKELAEKGCNVYIDMNNIPADPITNRMTFLDVSAQQITLTGSYPELVTDKKTYVSEPFPDEYYNWNTVYITGLKQSLGKIRFEDTELDFAGKSQYDNITFIGLNILYQAYTTGDSDITELLSELINADLYTLPERQLVPISITYDTNKITIESEYDNVNTTIAYNDTYSSQQNIENNMNLLYVDKGKTIITMQYPYLIQGIFVSLAGIAVEFVLLYFLFRKNTTAKKEEVI